MIAMSLARIVQVPIYDVVDVITVRYAFVSAASTVHVSGLMPLAGVVGGAIGGVTRINRKRTLVYMAVMDMMKVPVMHVIDVLAMLNGSMTTTFAMLVFVAFMCFAAHFD